MVTGGSLAEVASAIVAGGPLRFDRYLDLALYGRHGFYTSAGRAGGRRGDFITSPEVGPLFGAVLGRALDSCWVELGRPDTFPVIEVGAGPGTLARAVLSSAPACLPALRYVAVEISAAQRSAHPPPVESRTTIPDEPVAGMVIANEFLDNLPFRLLVWDSGWREAHVDVDRNGQLVEVLLPVSEQLPRWLPKVGVHGARIPWQERATSWVGRTRAQLTEGRVIAIDYVTPTTAEIASMPWREWLRTYRGHERGTHYLRDVGLQDITTQVALDQLPEPDALRTQAQFLQRWGIEDLVEAGRAAWTAAAASPDVAALRMRSRIAEAAALVDPVGLGRFVVMEWSARPDAPLPGPLRSSNDSRGSRA